MKNRLPKHFEGQSQKKSGFLYKNTNQHFMSLTESMSLADQTSLFALIIFSMKHPQLNRQHKCSFALWQELYIQLLALDDPCTQLLQKFKNSFLPHSGFEQFFTSLQIYRLLLYVLYGCKKYFIVWAPTAGLLNYHCKYLAASIMNQPKLDARGLRPREQVDQNCKQV